MHKYCRSELEAERGGERGERGREERGGERRECRGLEVIDTDMT